MTGSFEKRGDIGIIWIDNPPVNAISAVVRATIMEGCARLNEDDEIKAGVLACKGRTFMAGADISEFGKPMGSPTLPEVVCELLACKKPIVAAIFGTALGGGLECALGCDYRVALASAKVGLPEIKLGIFPGAGGTQLLPRLVGLDTAFNVIISGEPVPAEKAADMGIVDAVVADDVLNGAIAYANDVIANGAKTRKLSHIEIDDTKLPADYFEQLSQRIPRKQQKLEAAQRIVEALKAAATLPFEKGLERERELFMLCQQSLQAKAMQHVFFAERKVSNIPNLDKSVQPREINSVAIIGAGTMGGGIAMNFLNVGIPVTMLEVKQEALDRGVGVIRKNYESTAAKGRITSEQVEEFMGLLTPTLSYSDLADADLIIEAVFETMAIKKVVFGQLDQVAKQGAILASNTSYLSIDEIAAATSRPQDVLGMHFFSPANIMRLCEVVRGEKTAQDVLVTALAVTKRIKKVGVVCADSDGFIGNRMLGGYGYQASACLLEGAMPEQIDAVMRNFGMPMGPIQMSDLAGLDIGYKSRKDRDPDSFDGRVYLSADTLVEMGRLGQKTQAGFYDYAPGDRTPRPSAVVAEVLENSAKAAGVERRAISDEEILERCMLSLVNVGCDVLAENVAYRASDIDVVYINGYGFPAYRGGPMFWAEHEVGLEATLEKLKKYSAQTGGKWLKVSPLLEKLVAEGKGFD
jgi:3-hydroxyacyl-CoA dehydrogenase